ncbi:hypothetical protein GGH94_003337 [Coemansia aciculifera]|uniref:Fungal-type protein kinase domain-containing protein n=1 Tax=Coemansia aciculifera TaxID=417176 RepID=A0A9W8IQM8_9FUNG|nr:hypothetical protein GGH94_003337 [Coemansia aciculifera]
MSSESLGNSGSSESERNSKSKQESSSLAQEKIIVVPEVLFLALPLDNKTRSIAADATKSVTQLLQAMLSLTDQNLLPELSPHSEQGADTLGQPPVLLPDDVYSRLQSLARDFKPWVDCNAATERDETIIYPYFRKLVLFVMEGLKALPLATSPRDRYRLLLPYTGSRDFTPKDSLENFRMDQALFIRNWGDDIGNGIDEPKYVDMLAVVEIKVDDSPKASSKTSSRTSSKSNLASLNASGVCPKSNIGVVHGQLIRYTRQIYEHQHNRLLVWGVSSCGSLVRVYLFGPDCALSTDDLDMRTSAGRKQFIGWLINMCLCEDVRCGLIPSMRYVDGTAAGKGMYWELSVPKLDSNGAETDETTVYYSKKPSVAAGSTFGRHTRGFPASATLDDIDNPDVFVKVAWQYADRGPGPIRKAEIQHLMDIRDKYASARPNGVEIPRILAGGTVATMDRDGKRVYLTSDTAYENDIATRYRMIDDVPMAADKGNSSSRFRSQLPPSFNLDSNAFARTIGNEVSAVPRARRLLAFRQVNMLATKPLCEPLSSVRNADELIIVLADAMLAHNWMRTECNLLHRDISSNNIMVGRRRTSDGGYEVYGLLIDFDYAINPSDRRLSRPERTGTLPFMSILNLEAHPEQQTELADMESLLYVLCFQATFGINEADAKVLRLTHETLDPSLLKIKKWQGWQEGKTMASIASDKRGHLDSLRMFEADITGYFPVPDFDDLEDSDLPNYYDLQLFACELYGALFANPCVDKRCHGAKQTSTRVPRRQIGNPVEEDNSLNARLRNLTLVKVDPLVERAKDPAKKTIVDSFIKAMKDNAASARKRITALSPS